MSTRRGLAALTLVALIAAGAGCGGDDTPDAPVAKAAPPSAAGGTSSTTATHPPSTTVASTASTTPVDEDVVADVGLVPVLLTLEDLGDEWSYASHGPTPSLLETFVQEGQCARPAEAAFPQPVDTEDADFHGGEGWREADQVSSAAGRFATDGADGWFDAALDRVSRCDDPSIVAKEITPLDGLGDEAVLMQIAVDLGPTITTARFDVAVARVEEVVAVVATLTASVDALDEVRLLRTMVDRL